MAAWNMWIDGSCWRWNRNSISVELVSANCSPSIIITVPIASNYSVSNIAIRISIPVPLLNSSRHVPSYDCLPFIHYRSNHCSCHETGFPRIFGLSSFALAYSWPFFGSPSLYGCAFTQFVQYLDVGFKNRRDVFYENLFIFFITKSWLLYSLPSWIIYISGLQLTYDRKEMSMIRF